MRKNRILETSLFAIVFLSVACKPKQDAEVKDLNNLKNSQLTQAYAFCAKFDTVSHISQTPTVVPSGTMSTVTNGKLNHDSPTLTVAFYVRTSGETSLTAYPYQGSSFLDFDKRTFSFALANGATKALTFGKKFGERGMRTLRSEFEKKSFSIASSSYELQKSIRSGFGSDVVFLTLISAKGSQSVDGVQLSGIEISCPSDFKFENQELMNSVSQNENLEKLAWDIPSAAPVNGMSLEGK